jgi:hypothetical protein
LQDRNKKICADLGQPDLSREYAQKSLILAEPHKLKDLAEEVQALLGEMKQ